MKLTVIGTGSLGNSYVLESSSGSQLMLECGLKFEILAAQCDLTKLQCVITSHDHLDHILSAKDLEYCGIDVYHQSDLFAGTLYAYGEWKILPVPMKHGSTPCNSYIIYNTKDNKYIYFATDFEKIQGAVADKPFDLLLMECNYSQEIAQKHIDSGEIIHSKYFTHNSQENLLEWLKSRQNKPHNLVVCHTSNSGLLDLIEIKEKIEPYAKKSYIASKGLKVDF